MVFRNDFTGRKKALLRCSVRIFGSKSDCFFSAEWIHVSLCSTLYITTCGPVLVLLGSRDERLLVVEAADDRSLIVLVQVVHQPVVADRGVTSGGVVVTGDKLPEPARKNMREKYIRERTILGSWHLTVWLKRAEKRAKQLRESCDTDFLSS